ncbi:DENN domain-containing protein 3 [Liparis tanakae]|uniref:DENN domain-containing protein 3 n=1 Tax=Liparis tanakae TaxID=230148 RepID=A0A4Z2ISK3_9TELE|nr:DENN domain-containing protein 3 [Liparis tanakae]
MADHLPPVLLEACVVLGASSDKLSEVYQAMNGNGSPEHLLLDPEVLYILAPPFVSRPRAESEAVRPHGKRRRSFLQKKRKLLPPAAAASPIQGGREEASVPKDIDLMALPQLCFPGGLQVTNEQKDEQFHFLVFTDVFGNKTHGVGGTSALQEGVGSLKSSKLFSAYSFCVISKYPYFTALKDCLSWPQQLLQGLSCLLQEQRVVLFSADWARLTLVAESFLLFLQPLSWQQPYVPVLARGMLDFLMAPTAFLMGCHLRHFEEVATETDDLVLINIDNGSVSTSCSETLGLPEIPSAAADCFTERCQTLQINFDLSQCNRASCTDISEQRAQRRAWQHKLNLDIQRITLELIVNIFRFCVLETHIFHSFLKDRLYRKMDNFARMELSTRSEMHRMKAMVEVPRRRTMQEIQARRKSSIPGSAMSKRLGMSLPDLGHDNALSFRRNTMLSRIIMSDSALRTPPKAARVFRLPDFPASLSFYSVQSYYRELIQLLSKAIFSVQKEDSMLLARFYYLRGFINTLCWRRLDALGDFQNLNKTDTAIFPTQLVTWLVDSLHRDERQQADRRPELKRLILRVKTDNEKLSSVQPDDHVTKFELPRKHLPQEEFVRCVQDCGIVKDVATIHRLFDALTNGQPKQVDPKLFRVFYTFWKETEAEAQDFNLPSEVIEHLDDSECVYKLSSCVKTSLGVGKIAMTQKRLVLLTVGRQGFLEITKFRDIQVKCFSEILFGFVAHDPALLFKHDFHIFVQEVKIATAPFLLLRIPSLRIQTSGRVEVFEANLKTETELWNLVVKEMWAGRKMADLHKDPQYITEALTNVLLMDAVMGCLQTQRPIIAASKLAYFDKIKHEAPMMVPKTTSETLKHKINPSLGLAEPQTVHVLLYTPGQLTCNDSKSVMNPKLWVALSGGKVVVFDAASWSMLQECIQVGASQLVRTDTLSFL